MVCKGKKDLQTKKYIEGIQILVMNMTFISWSEGEKLYLMSGEA